ncbi:MAG: glycosyltransferase [Planctomycetota bacterium]|nr:glycosyltransferase [Planctomycetota bacterium]
MGAALNRWLLPAPEVYQGAGDPALHVILVATRWEYGSRFNADGFEYRRFLPALRRLAGTVSFVPVEGGGGVVTHIQSLLQPAQRTVAFSVFQKVQSVPSDYSRLSRCGIFLTNWYTDDDMLFDRFSKYVGRQFDLNVTTFEPNLPRYEAISARAIASQWAGLGGCEFRESRRYAACFVGRMYGQREGLMKRLRDEFGSRVFLHDTRSKPIRDDAMVSAYQDSWIAIDDPLAYDGKTRQIKARIFENASMGCIVATQPNDRLHRYYEPGREIVFWETPSDLVGLIHDSIENPQPYRRMARAAYDRTQREHLYDHRFAALFHYIGEHSILPV